MIAAFAVWWFSPVQVVKRRSLTLLRTLTLSPGSSNTSRQLGTYSLNALLASEVELENPTIKEANGLFERSEMESAFQWLCGQAKQSQFQLEKFNAVNIDGNRAKVQLTITGLVELQSYRMADGKYDSVFEWVKEKDGWRLTRATWVEAK